LCEAALSSPTCPIRQTGSTEEGDFPLCLRTPKVKGKPYTKAEFYIYGELFCGSIEFGDLMYVIAVTSEEYNEKTVHIVFLID
jgi:hypothetical protein